MIHRNEQKSKMAVHVYRRNVDCYTKLLSPFLVYKLESSTCEIGLSQMDFFGRLPTFRPLGCCPGTYLDYSVLGELSLFGGRGGLSAEGAKRECVPLPDGERSGPVNVF